MRSALVYIPQLLTTGLCLSGSDSMSQELSGTAATILAQMQVFQPATNFPLVGMQILIVIWVFILGTCFGSFLNVVIYRLPAGMSLRKPKSRCPRCETPLAARDNIPVLGWLSLRGRCRYCELPISARYPLIESVCGGLFLALLFGELLTGATNLPLRPLGPPHDDPRFWLIWFTRWDLTGLYLYHCCLLVLVLAISMIGYDGHPAQKKLKWFGIGVALVFGSMWWELHPVPAFSLSQALYDLQWGFSWTDPLFSPGHRYWTGLTLVGLLDGIAGVLAGMCVGWLVRWQTNPRDTKNSLPAVSAISDSFVVTGAFLGWQAVGMLAVIVLPIFAALRLLTRRTPDSRLLKACAPAFFTVLLMFLLNWQRLNASDWMIGLVGWSFTPLNWWMDWLATLGCLLVLAGLTRSVSGGEPAD